MGGNMVNFHPEIDRAVLFSEVSFAYSVIVYVTRRHGYFLLDICLFKLEDKCS